VADWAVGASADDYAGANGLAVDPTGTYLAVSFRGLYDSGFTVNGNTKILSAATGALITNLDLGLPMDGQPFAIHDDTDCAWDAVGNIYYIDNYYGYWRAVSPPGTNQATTSVTGVVHVGLAPILITSIQTSNGIVTLDFTGATSDSPGAFVLQGAAAITGPFVLLNSANITGIGPGLFRATVPMSGPSQFYRVRR
jgi:hypothetical protein